MNDALSLTLLNAKICGQVPGICDWLEKSESAGDSSLFILFAR